MEHFRELTLADLFHHWVLGFEVARVGLGPQTIYPITNFSFISSTKSDRLEILGATVDSENIQILGVFDWLGHKQAFQRGDSWWVLLVAVLILKECVVADHIMSLLHYAGWLSLLHQSALHYDNWSFGDYYFSICLDASQKSTRMTLFNYLTAIAPESWIKCFSEVFAYKIVFIEPIFEFQELHFMIISELFVNLTNKLIPEIKVLILEAQPSEWYICNARGVDYWFFIEWRARGKRLRKRIVGFLIFLSLVVM